MVALINPNMTAPRFEARPARTKRNAQGGRRHLQAVPELTVPEFAVPEFAVPAGLASGAEATATAITSTVTAAVTQVSSVRTQTVAALRMLVLACVIAGALIGVRFAQGSPATLDASDQTPTSVLSDAEIVLSVAD